MFFSGVHHTTCTCTQVSITLLELYELHFSAIQAPLCKPCVHSAQQLSLSVCANPFTNTYIRHDGFIETFPPLSAYNGWMGFHPAYTLLCGKKDHIFPGQFDSLWVHFHAWTLGVVMRIVFTYFMNIIPGNVGFLITTHFLPLFRG